MIKLSNYKNLLIFSHENYNFYSTGFLTWDWNDLMSDSCQMTDLMSLFGINEILDLVIEHQHQSTTSTTEDV